MPPARSLLVLCVGTLALAACGDREAERPSGTADAPAAAAPAQAAGTVLDLARRDPELTTLVSALQTAGVDAALEQAGPYTVFAPTNAAFEKVPAETRDALATPEGQADLRRLLTFHIVPGRLEAAALVQRIQAAGGAIRLTTLQGGVLVVETAPDGSLTLTDAAGGEARVVETDRRAANGVIHAIDTVVQPG